MIQLLLSLPKSIYFNLRVLGLKGWKCPILINQKVKIKRCSGRVQILSSPIRFGMIHIGFGGTDSTPSRKSMLILNKDSLISFAGNAQFSEGVVIKNKGRIVVGKNFAANKNFTLSISDGIKFGDDVLLGWSVYIRDSDGHNVFDMSSAEHNYSKSVEPISIGNHVWIASDCHLLKGTIIPDNCVIGYKSLVTRKFKKTNCIIAGHPAIIVKENILWEK